MQQRMATSTGRVGGKARLEEGSIRIIGGWKKDTLKRLYNIAV